MDLEEQCWRVSETAQQVNMLQIGAYHQAGQPEFNPGTPLLDKENQFQKLVYMSGGSLKRACTYAQINISLFLWRKFKKQNNFIYIQ